MIPHHGQTSSLPGILGQEWWSHHKPRVFFYKGNPHLYRKVLPSNVRCDVRDCCDWDRAGLGDCLRTTPRIQCHRPRCACDWSKLGCVILLFVAFSTPQHNSSGWAASCLAEVCLWRCFVALHTDGPRTGYSFKTNQYGLSLDTVVGFNLVLPNGTIAYVTESTHPDLFFGLKGGFNNFVSRSTNATFTQFN